MKVLIAAAHGSMNGIERYVYVLGRSLLAAGHEVAVAQIGRDLEVEVAPHGAKVLPIQASAPHLSRLIGPWSHLPNAMTLRSIAKRQGYIVHAAYPMYLTPWGDQATVATAWHSHPGVVARTRSARQRSERTRSEFLYATSDRAAYRSATRVVAVSTATEDALAVCGLKDKTVFLPPFLDGDPSRCRATGSGRLIFAARWLDSERKRLSLAVEAVRLLRRRGLDVTLDLVGEFGRHHGPLPLFCHERGLVPSSEIEAAMRHAAACVVSSSYEEFGYVALDALHAGVPVACSPLPALRGLPTDGICVAPEDSVEGLASAILAATGLTDFEFPPLCRATQAVFALLNVYEEARDG